MEEIEKLRLRVEKDPNSRLFLPLAEEYRKSGMLDEAITIILRGLEYQPGYTSARVALGRLYLEKNMIEEARNEFENVVKSIPDNLFSHKKLAEIYKASGHIDMAVGEYKKVLELNPLDDDARMSLDEIEGKPGEAEELFSPVSPIESAAPAVEDVASPLRVEEEREEEILTEAGADGAFEEFESAFSPASGETVEDAKDFFQPPAEEMGIDEDIFASGAEDGRAEDVLETHAEEADVIELPEDAGFEDAFAMDSHEVAPGGLSASDAAAGQSFFDSEEELPAADSFIEGGNYYKAMEIYRKILAADPDNRTVLQRVSELKGLLKMLGRSDEVLISRLDALLGAIKRNFDRGR